MFKINIQLLALQKTVQTPYNVEANYHKVALTNVDWYNKRAHIEVLTFKDEETRRDPSKLPLGTFSLDIDTDQFDFTPDSNVVEIAYGKIKLLPGFEDAIDLL